MAKMLDCHIAVNKFELQSRYYVNFRINALGKSIKLLIHPAIVFRHRWLCQ